MKWDKEVQDALDNIVGNRVSINDGIGNLIAILGGIGLQAAETRGLLKTANSAEEALKLAGVLGANLVGIGGAITTYCAKNLNAANKKGE